MVHYTNTDNPVDFPKSTTAINHVKGNLLMMADNGDFDVIIHGCNCHCAMGAGIAKQIALIYPQAYDADLMTTPGDRSKLGTITCAEAINKDGKSFIIVNAYTQYDTAKSGEDVFEYEAFQRILDAFAVDGANMRIGLPYIGMGLAGGNKERIMGMIEDFAQKIASKNGLVTLVEFG